METPKHKLELVRDHWEREIDHANNVISMAERQLGKIALPGQLRLQVIHCADQDRFYIVDENRNIMNYQEPPDLAA